MRILYVEDNPANLMLVQRIARMGGHEILNYTNGVAVLENFDQIVPDLILMDIQLEGPLNGLDVVKKLRADGHTMPIIAVTAYAMVGDREKCLQAGCNDYLAKPLPVSRLVEIFSQHTVERDTPSTSEQQATTPPTAPSQPQTPDPTPPSDTVDSLPTTPPEPDPAQPAPLNNGAVKPPPAAADTAPDGTAEPTPATSSQPESTPSDQPPTKPETASQSPPAAGQTRPVTSPDPASSDQTAAQTEPETGHEQPEENITNSIESHN